MAVDRELNKIDRQITQLWRLYRRWHSTGTTQLSPVEALSTIDMLLEQRRLLMGSSGEFVDARDVASSVEWGGADTGAAA